MSLAIRNTQYVIRHWGILLIFILGFFVRVNNLTYHSLWFDEAVSLRWARSSVSRIIEVGMNLVEDRLPPLYYLLLKWWGDLAGFSEFSVRYLSVIFGVLLIPIVYMIGQRLLNRHIGLLAALLTALNPFLIWYSQEARMYALAALVSTFGVLCFIIPSHPHPSTPPPRRLPAPPLPYLGLGLAALAGLYTHLYTAFLWPALAIWLLLNPKLLKRVWLPFGLTMSAVLILFLPLVQAIWRFSAEGQPGDPFSGVWARAWTLFQAFIIWEAPLSAAMTRWTAIVLGLFLILGIVMSLRSRAGWLMILLLAMPFVIASILLLRSDLAFFGLRYFIVMVPWLVLLQAFGAVELGGFLARVVFEGDRGRRMGHSPSPPTPLPSRERGATPSPCKGEGRGGGRSLNKIQATTLLTLPALLLIAFTLIPLPGQWSIPASKEAWRQTVTYMRDHVQPDDAVFIHPEWIRFAYQYYEDQLQPPGQTYAAFFSVDEHTDLDGPLNGVVGEHPVVWLIQSHIEQPDPDHRVENWFASRYPLVTELYPPGIVLKAYAPGYQLDALPPGATSMDIVFDGGLQLRGFHLPMRTLSARDDLFHPPSNWVHVTLYWAAPMGATDVMPYVHMIDTLGQVWGASLDRGSDALRIYPPSRWGPDQVIRQDVDVNVNPAAPPGNYQLVVGIGEEKVFFASVTLVEN